LVSSLNEEIALKQQRCKDITNDSIDAFLRRRFKQTLAHSEPPAGGRKRLLAAAYAESQPSNSRFDHLLALIETEQYSDLQGLIPWVAASRFHSGILSIVKMR
jgi:hypothetical protein